MADKPGMGHTTLALFLAAGILVGLFEDSDRERARGPIHLDRFRLGSAVQIAAALVLGPWAAALVAAVGTVAAGLFHGVAPRKVAFDSLAYAGAACVAGLVFEVAGGDVGNLSLLDDLIPVVALALAYLTVRALLLDVVLARESFDPRLVASAGEAGLGAALALLSIGHPWNVVVLVPLAVAVHQGQVRLRNLQRETLRALETFANIVADSFDAMTTDRPYRKGLSHEAALMEIERNAGTQFHPAVAKAFVAVQRGIDPASVLTPDELAEIRGASAPYRIRVVGLGELKERPELIALGGVVLGLAGLGFDQTLLTAAGGAIALAGMALRAVVQVRAGRAAAALHRSLSGLDERTAVFRRVTEAMSPAWHHAWAALVAWDEDGLGGSVDAVSGTDGPAEAALMSWLVREAESGRDAIVAPGLELGVDGIAVALPLRRDNSALVGFLAFVAPKLPPRHVELALLESLDELGLALVARPELDSRGSQGPEPLETVADLSDLALVRFDER